MGQAGSRTRPAFMDPSRVNLRKAARATLVVTFLFAALVALGNQPVALFAAFGSFAALVFADFGGPYRARIGAYTVLLVAGAVLVALGWVCSDTTVLAVVAMLVVGFGITFSGALGGYFAAGATATILAFVLSVMSPAVEASFAARELGWCLGVGIAGVAAVALWPVRQRHRVRTAVVEVLDAAATALRAPAAARDVAPVHGAVAALEARAGIVYRPAGSMARDRALVALVVAVRRAARLLDALQAAESSPDSDTLPEYGALAARTAAVLTASARLLERNDGGTIDLDGVLQARTDHTDALGRWAAGELAGADAEAVVARFDAAFPLRRLSLLAAELGVQAARATRADVIASDASALPDEVRAPRGAWPVLRAHLDPRSVRFRNAARAGIGLAVAVLIARGASLEHAFWVVLGTLSVLRSNALGTGATALQALLGALVGFAVATALMLTVGGDARALWVILPIVVFSSAYTPAAVNFVVGQASFTVFVVVLFNLLVPEGWRTGLVRVQDVAIGAGISVAVGALLWPRGARGVARAAFAGLRDAARRDFEVALGVTLAGEPEADAAAARTAVAETRSRAVAALEDLAVEHGGGQVDRESWDGRLAGATALRIAADGVLRTRAVHALQPSGCPATRAALEADARTVLAAVDPEARPSPGSSPGSSPGPASARATLGSCLASHAGEGLEGVLGLVWVHEWIAVVGSVTQREQG